MTSSHGGDLVSAKTVYDGAILDLSVNVNPLGTPPEVLEAARAALSRAGEYPDSQCRALRAAIATLDGVTDAQVFCGNGASDVIFRLALALKPRAALLTAPTFSEYEAALRYVGCDCRFHLLKKEHDFDVTETILEEIEAPVALVMLCNPNNPTGRVIDRALLEKILAKCEKIGAILAVDECFLPLAQSGRGLADLLSGHPNLVLLRAFTKTYALAGLRLGYALASESHITALQEAGAAWNVSIPAQEAGIACCARPDWPEEGRKLARALRASMQEGLAACGCEVIAGEANYLLFRAPGVADLKERLLKRGILIRSCANFRNLGDDWYRVALRSRETNEVFLRALREERMV